jgi:hypothetical protein
MDTKYRLHIASKDAGVDAVPDVKERGPMMLLLITLIILAFSVPLLATLPRTLDAAASPPPIAITAPRDMHSTERPFHERYPAQETSSWEDALEQSELATWRARASD